MGEEEGAALALLEEDEEGLASEIEEEEEAEEEAEEEVEEEAEGEEGEERVPLFYLLFLNRENILLKTESTCGTLLCERPNSSHLSNLPKSTIPQSC